MFFFKNTKSILGAKTKLVLKNKKYFTVDDHDELVADHVFYSHLEKRNNLITELESLEIKTLKQDFKC